MQNSALPIGVLDSGMGGLTVLKALRQALPAESFLYLGDTARLPYGTKSSETVKQYVLQLTKVLCAQKIKALVIACNTATTAALYAVELAYPNLPVIGVIKPGALAAISVTNNERIAVLATETTINSKAYQEEINKILPNAIIKPKACGLLVALAEEGMLDNSIAKETMLHYLSDCQDEDTLLLGCTHFPVFKPLLRKILPEHINIVDSADATAQALVTLLAQKNIKNNSGSTQVRYLVTDSKDRFQRIGTHFLGNEINSMDIKLIDL